MGSSRHGLAAVLLAGLVLGSEAGVVRAQDRAPRAHKCPSCGTELPQKRCATCGATLGPAQDDAEIDRKLRESLRREFGDPHGEPVPPPPPGTHDVEPVPPPPDEPPPPPPPPHEPKKHHDDDDAFRVTLGFYGAYWSAEIFEASVTSYRKNWFGSGLAAGGRARLDGGDDSVADLGRANTQTYRAWIDLGDHVSIGGGARYATYRDVAWTPPFTTFGSHYFTSAQPLMTKYEFLSADANVGVSPLACKWGRITILLGGRYVKSSVRFSTNAGPGGPDDEVSQTLEMLIPTVGLGGAFRPIHKKKVTVELYGQGEVGGYDLESRDGYRRRTRNGRRYYYYDEQDRHRYRAFTVVADGGVKVVLFQHVGLIAGYRFEVTQLMKEDRDKINKASWNVGGPYAGLVLQF